MVRQLFFVLYLLIFYEEWSPHKKNMNEKKKNRSFSRSLGNRSWSPPKTVPPPKKTQNLGAAGAGGGGAVARIL